MSKKVTFSDNIEILGRDDTRSLIPVKEFEEESCISKSWKRIKRSSRYLFFCFLLFCMYKYV